MKPTVTDIKYTYQRLSCVDGRNRHFFDRDTMKFFGDTMANYGVRDAGPYWELYRRRPVKHGLNTSAYFDKVTFDQVSIPENYI